MRIKRGFVLAVTFCAAAGVAFAGGLPSMSREAYLERASAAVEEALGRGNSEPAEEFAALLEQGAYADEKLLGQALARRVSRLLAGRLAAESETSSGERAKLRELLRRIEASRGRTAARGGHAPIVLPRDEAAHMRLAEWWYLNGHLTDEAGKEYGYELTFFHVRPGIFFVHTAVTDIAAGRFLRCRQYLSPLACRTPTDRLDLVYADAHALGRAPGGGYAVRGSAGKASLSLTLHPRKAPMIVNGDGIIDMPEGTFSWYYSLTRPDTEGELLLDGKRLRVTGLSWMDHQWGNFVTLRIGWDWFSVQLDDGSDFNIFSFRKGNHAPMAQYVNRLDGAAVLSTNHSVGLERLAWWRSPETGKDYVTRWRLTVPGHTPIEVDTRLDSQELPRAPLDPAPGYWEGTCSARSGNSAGVAYCEQFAFPRE
ncbi:MAG: hypothetical protein HY303_15545 [Candidatus Wallbacteria bacterium]|nr:hypothetical protein [Candidatus Wallbacteria bacterium]